MKKHAAILIILFSLACGSAGGYLLRAQKAEGTVVLSVGDVLQEEYLAPPDTFSRIVNTRHTLDALAARLRIGIMDALVAYKQLPQDTAPERKAAQRFLERAIDAAEAGMAEFEGTQQQLDLAQGLLLALKEAGRFDRWTEVYLEALHEYPTHPLVARLADDALKISKRAGQQERVLEALSYLNAFESTLAGSSPIEIALSSADPCLSQLITYDCAAGVDGM